MPCYAMLCHAMSCSLPPGSAPVTIDCDAFDTSLVSLLSLLHAGPLQPEFHPESSKTTDLQHGACCSCKRCKQAVESNCMRVLPQQDAPPERHLGPAALGTHHLKFTSLYTETWNVHAPQWQWWTWWYNKCAKKKIHILKCHLGPVFGGTCFDAIREHSHMLVEHPCAPMFDEVVLQLLQMQLKMSRSAQHFARP